MLHLHINVPRLANPGCGLLTGLVPCCNAKLMLVQIHDVQSYIYKRLVRLHSSSLRVELVCGKLAIRPGLRKAPSSPLSGLRLVVFVTLVLRVEEGSMGNRGKLASRLPCA